MANEIAGADRRSAANESTAGMSRPVRTGDVHRPALVIVSGPPGSGKTTMARQLAQALPCPLVSRDDINEGIFHTFGHDLAVVSKDSAARLAFDAFFRTIDLLLSSKATVVAEAAFQDPKWRQGLASITADANIKVIHCVIDPELARQRVRKRHCEQPDSPGSRRAALARQDRSDVRPIPGFEKVSLAVPSLCVATENGYDPSIEAIVGFIRT